MRYVFIKLIRFYQLAISPFLGSNCRYTPTCSQYGIEAFSKLPFHVAFWRTTKRILSCHPWAKGGHDPVTPDCSHKDGHK
ncbi:membrane protein insertion efficiency factor YidD [Halobacteriovorax sp. GFR7]|uniref:membrane protein insertion efficiency factor YidD n=1 Tax=unclassified Halobacteriovorax TaxID=2639665 RepID=UPI003716FE1B